MNHSFDVDLAVKYGVRTAILIHYLQLHNWTFPSVDELECSFPYLTGAEIFAIVMTLPEEYGSKVKFSMPTGGKCDVPASELISSFLDGGKK